MRKPTAEETTNDLHRIFQMLSAGPLEHLGETGTERSIGDITKAISYVQYGDPKHLTVAIGGISPIQVLPFNFIVISREFISQLEQNYSKEMIAAILCHEASHVLSNDWRRRVVREGSTTYVDKEVYWTTVIKSGWSKESHYKFAKKIWGYGEEYEKYMEQFRPDDWNLKELSKFSTEPERVQHPIGLLSSLQGFRLETELTADRGALECLKSIGVDSENMRLVLKTIKQSDTKADKEKIQIRLDNISSMERAP